MKKFRAIVALLLCLSLPWSALAGGLQDMQCSHHGAGAMSMMNMQQHHGDAGCEHMRKCECQHHCTGGSMAAMFVPIGTNLGAFDSPAFRSHRYAGLTAKAWPGLPFRPPIAAPAGAA